MAPTHLRQLGKGGPLVPAIGFGLMGMSIFYGTPPSDEERFKLLDRAIEIGATNWDTSDLYGDNEVLLGEYFRRSGKRDQVFLATKFGYTIKDASKHEFGFDTSPTRAKQACERSLQKLGIDSIDLFYVHHPDAVTPIEQTMRALAELKAEGKIKHIGLSHVSANTLRRAVKIAPVAAVQVEYSPFEREIEGPEGHDLLAICKELGIAVVCYSPLGRGILTGAFTTKQDLSDPKDGRAEHMPWFRDGALEANAKVVAAFQKIADKHNCSTAQLSLAWLLKQDDMIIPIPGTKKIERLEHNWAALDVNLSDADDEEINKFLKDNKLVGTSVKEEHQAEMFMDSPEEA